MTNADKIRQMSDAELCVFLRMMGYALPPYCPLFEDCAAGCDEDCEKCRLTWLKQEGSDNG